MKVEDCRKFVWEKARVVVLAAGTEAGRLDNIATTVSQNVKMGSPSVRTASSRAIISLSVLEWDTAVYVFAKLIIGAKEFGPTIAR